MFGHVCGCVILRSPPAKDGGVAFACDGSTTIFLSEDQATPCPFVAEAEFSQLDADRYRREGGT